MGSDSNEKSMSKDKNAIGVDPTRSASVDKNGLGVDLGGRRIIKKGLGVDPSELEE
jgi:hypothetical protein